MPKYVLHYFDGRGRAEVARILFRLAGIEFTDNRVKDWPEQKSLAPLGQLPYLEIDDIKLPQSLAIQRYLAKEANVLGKNNLEQAQADAVVDTCIDGYNAYVDKVIHAANDKKAEAQEDFLKNDLPKHLKNIEKLIELFGKDGFSVSDSLTWADIFAFEFVFATHARLSDQDANFLANYPRIQAVYETVRNHEKLADYFKTRPQTSF